MKVNSDIVELAAEIAYDHLNTKLDSRFVYHDLSHTIQVVEGVSVIAKKMQLSKQEKNLLAIAAWFHDTGYTKQIDEHELHSAELAESFLNEYEIAEEEIHAIRQCILSTKYPQKPASLMQQVICDADMMHLAAKNFMNSSEKLRKEWELTKALQFSDKEWLRLNIDFISTHKFHTAYAQEFLQKDKEKNIEILKPKLKLAEKQEKESLQPEKQKKQDVQQAGGGVETLFMIAAGNHMKLSGMADTKAHILLSINSIIISLILSVLAQKLTDATYLLYPTILLLLICVTTTVFAILTVKPKISRGVFTTEQLNNKEVNLLFFGNFHGMEMGTYEMGVQELINDKDYLYKSITRDIYFLGKVLATKYRYLNIGYRIFMYGLVASILAFVISFLFATPTV